MEVCLSDSSSSFCQYAHLVPANQSCSWRVRFLCAYPCLLWRGYISCPMAAVLSDPYMRSHGDDDVPPPPLQAPEARLPSCNLCNLFLNIQWRRSSGILGSRVTQHVTETRNQEHSSQSYALVCPYTSLHAERVRERLFVYERDCCVSLTTSLIRMPTSDLVAHWVIGRYVLTYAENVRIPESPLLCFLCTVFFLR